MLEELRADGGTTTLELRRRLAATAFARSAAYDAAITRWFQRGTDFPESFVPAFDRVRELPYGENPHQSAAYYAERGARTHLLAFVGQLQGKELSFNNLGDLSAARLLLCGARPAGMRDREAREPVRGRRRRHGGGGVCEGARGRPGLGLRRRRRREPRGDGRARGGARSSSSSRCCSRRAYEPAAVEISRRKPSLRVLEHTDQRAPGESGARLPAGARRAPRAVPGPRDRGSRLDEGRVRRGRRRRSGTTCCSRFASSSTSPRTRSCSRVAGRPSGSEPGR